MHVALPSLMGMNVRATAVIMAEYPNIHRHKSHRPHQTQYYKHNR
jgi:hypothetical protein